MEWEDSSVCSTSTCGVCTFPQFRRRRGMRRVIIEYGTSLDGYRGYRGYLAA